MAKCPHADIRFCPLYVVAHDGALGTVGCIKGEWAEGCAVKRGRMRYIAAVGRLYLQAPELVDECRFGEEQHEAQEQRRRNLRINGIH